MLENGGIVDHEIVRLCRDTVSIFRNRILRPDLPEAIATEAVTRALDEYTKAMTFLREGFEMTWAVRDPEGDKELKRFSGRFETLAEAQAVIQATGRQPLWEG